jgi:hypothetical protein
LAGQVNAGISSAWRLSLLIFFGPGKTYKRLNPGPIEYERRERKEKGYWG